LNEALLLERKIGKLVLDEKLGLREYAVNLYREKKQL